MAVEGTKLWCARISPYASLGGKVVFLGWRNLSTDHAETSVRLVAIRAQCWEVDVLVAHIYILCTRATHYLFVMLGGGDWLLFFVVGPKVHQHQNFRVQTPRWARCGALQWVFGPPRSSAPTVNLFHALLLKL